MQGELMASFRRCGGRKAAARVGEASGIGQCVVVGELLRMPRMKAGSQVG